MKDTLLTLLKELNEWKQASSREDGYYLDEMEIRIFKMRQELTDISFTQNLKTDLLNPFENYPTLSVEDLSGSMASRLYRKLNTLETRIKEMKQGLQQKTFDSVLLAINDIYKTFKEIANG